MEDPESVADATERAIAAATHLTAKDAGAVATLRTLARKIDSEQILRERALQWADDHDERPPSIDNVSIPTYLKYSESLGLTPAGRLRFAEQKEEAVGGAKLAGLRAAGGKSA